MVPNAKNELITTRTITGWRVCMDYKKLSTATCKDHLPKPFIDQMLDMLAGSSYYLFLDGYYGYNQINIALEDQENTTFTCPYETFAFNRMPFGLYFANYLVTGIIPDENKSYQKRKFLRDSHQYNWDKPYLFRTCADNIIQHCVLEGECQRQGNIGRRKEMSINFVMEVEVLDIWAIDFMGPFVSSGGMKYILVAVDYVSKWVEVVALPNNKARGVMGFFKKNIFTRFGTPRAIISDAGSHFCNRAFAGLMEKYEVKHRVVTPYHA
ncbi:uncharacterized protein LOC132601646 [Lycium barbarum]|uniref:uncharacterized protein LOC132601646 n=1 Tax=Lycium barbarum TaxID=112863 RepID=UPI00293F178E|nr:uncharacterized protein LOC132601646 [Lycium barbarum]